jgi:hypothetical protein
MTLPAPLDHVTPRSAVEQYRAGIDNALVALAESMRVQIAALAESMRALRSRRNSLAPISCLPNEVLATVFKHLAEEKSFQSYPGANHSPPCVRVTHVCRHWRQVALEYPSLWAFVDCTCARWIGVMLERSKKAALVVTCNASSLPPECLEQVLSQLPRIKVLRLYSHPWDVDRALVHLSSQPAPLLQNFKFVVIGGEFRHTFRPVSDVIFQGQVPQLRSLELTTGSFGWTSCIFSGLRTLYVRGIGFTSSSTLSEFLPALRRIPELEWLTLERLSIVSGENRVSSDKVPLARLKSIVLDATIQTAVTLFTHLTLPCNAKIALDLTNIEGHQNISDLFSAMDKGPGKSGPALRSLCTLLSPASIVVQFSKSMESERLYSSKTSHKDVRLSVQFHWDSSVSIEPIIIFDICRIVAQGTIRSLSVSSFKNLEEPFWRTGSANLPSLERIHVSNSSIEGLLAALQIEETENADIAYPSLHVLDFKYLDFLEYEPGDLHGILVMRGRLCAPLDKLRLTECRGLMDDDVELLEEVVEVVDWDGHEESVATGSESDSDSYTSYENTDSDSDAW